MAVTSIWAVHRSIKDGRHAEFFIENTYYVVFAVMELTADIRKSQLFFYVLFHETGYKWVERNNQPCSMSDRSHAPLYIPGRTPAEIEEAILRVRADNSEWGAKTILKVLENNGYTDLPCIRTANNILQRNGCIFSVFIHFLRVM